jgi:hypothetical protein
MRLAEHGREENVDLEGNYSLEELNEMVAVMKKLMRARDVILKVNREYIRSAAQADEYRTEPAFKLQGSYRNMNRIAEKVVAIMNDDELESLILSSYESDSQTLTSDQEANMLKFKELMGIITPDEQNRWDDIKRTFQQNLKMHGIEAGDDVGLVLAQLSSLNDGLHAIQRAVVEGVGQLSAADDGSEEREKRVAEIVDQLKSLKGGMESIGSVLGGGLQQLTQLGRSQPEPLNADAMKALLEEVRGSSKPGELGPEAQKVIVQHRVPKLVIEVLRHQFELMQSWMQPILTATNLQSSDIQQLQKALDAALNSYALLADQVDDLPPSPPPGDS